MSSNKKRFSVGLVLGVSLGLASGAVYATGPLTDTFASGGTLTATQMNNIKNAVNDLQGNVPSTSCRTNAGAVDAGATRVGPLCVETARRAADSWINAVTTCNTANKRLLTPGEYVAAKAQAGLTLGMTTNNEFEWVDAAASDASAATTAGRLQVGYMGPATAAVITGFSGADGDLFFGTNADYDNNTYGIFYRCAR